MYNQYNSPFLQEKFPEIKEENKGKFTAWVKKNMPGKSTCEAASAVMGKKDKYSEAVVKMANYAKNFGCSKKSNSALTKQGKSLEDLQNHLKNLNARLDNTVPGQKKLKPMLVKQIAATKEKIQALKNK
jgi:conjugal transfer/entry exclusion protein|tara:strand:+ start:3081 stop:3467 length:387 start_codon:yes stop_codon:yes gene_type:complete